MERTPDETYDLLTTYRGAMAANDPNRYEYVNPVRDAQIKYDLTTIANPTSPKMFPSFRKLSAEVRQMIWIEALPCARTLRAHFKTISGLGDDYQEIHIRDQSLDKSHALSAVNFESRKIFLKHYTPCFARDGYFGFRGSFNPKIDTLIFDYFYLWAVGRWLANRKRPRTIPYFNRLENVAIYAECEGDHDDMDGPIPHFFPSLKQMTFVIEPETIGMSPNARKPVNALVPFNRQLIDDIVYNYGLQNMKTGELYSTLQEFYYEGTEVKRTYNEEHRAEKPEFWKGVQLNLALAAWSWTYLGEALVKPIAASDDKLDKEKAYHQMGALRFCIAKEPLDIPVNTDADGALSTLKYRYEGIDELFEGYDE